MQEKRNKTKLILLIALTMATTAVAWIFGSQNANDVDRTMFQPVSTQVIDKVVLESGDRVIELSFVDNKWRVNGEWEADRNMIKVLMATLMQAEVKRPVPASIRDSVAHAAERSGTRVSLMSNGDTLQTFFASGNAAKTQSFFRAPDSGETYIVAIPGYRVYVTGIFELDKNGWRDRSVFSFNWRNFATLKTSFPANPSADFTVAPDNNMFGVSGIQTDTTRLAPFMDRLLTLTVDEFLSGRVADSLTSARPLVIFDLNDISGRKYRLELFPEPERNQFLALINEKDAARIDSRKVGDLIRPKAFFAISK